MYPSNEKSENEIKKIISYTVASKGKKLLRNKL